MPRRPFQARAKAGGCGDAAADKRRGETVYKRNWIAGQVPHQGEWVRQEKGCESK
jgi:hypothetical protein